MGVAVADSGLKQTRFASFACSHSALLVRRSKYYTYWRVMINENQLVGVGNLYYQFSQLLFIIQQYTT